MYASLLYLIRSRCFRRCMPPVSTPTEVYVFPTFSAEEFFNDAALISGKYATLPYFYMDARFRNRPNRTSICHQDFSRSKRISRFLVGCGRIIERPGNKANLKKRSPSYATSVICPKTLPEFHGKSMNLPKNMPYYVG